MDTQKAHSRERLKDVHPSGRLPRLTHVIRMQKPNDWEKEEDVPIVV